MSSLKEAAGAARHELREKFIAPLLRAEIALKKIGRARLPQADEAYAVAGLKKMQSILAATGPDGFLKTASSMEVLARNVREIESGRAHFAEREESNE